MEPVYKLHNHHIPANVSKFHFFDFSKFLSQPAHPNLVIQ